MNDRSPNDAPHRAPRDAAWYDEQYDNRRRVPIFATHLERWRVASDRARAGLRCELDVPFTPDGEMALDVFTCAQRNAPVLVFFHGGYWRSLDKSDFSFVAAPFVAAGVTVVIPNYALCPTVTIDAISMQAAQAMAWVHRFMASRHADPTRCVVAGHSAGGHLATMLLACDGRRLGPGLPARLMRHAVSLSGLYDLAPIAAAPSLQVDLRLDDATIARNSPARFAPPRGAQLCSVVGALESEEFRRHNRLIRERWGPRVVPVCEELPGCDHFTVLDELVAPEAALHSRVLAWLLP